MNRSEQSEPSAFERECAESEARWAEEFQRESAESDARWAELNAVIAGLGDGIDRGLMYAHLVGAMGFYVAPADWPRVIESAKVQAERLRAGVS